MGTTRPAFKETLNALATQTPANVPRIADCLISTAIEWGASDIHLDPSLEGARIRFRIDGVLEEVG